MDASAVIRGTSVRAGGATDGENGERRQPKGNDLRPESVEGPPVRAKSCGGEGGEECDPGSVGGKSIEDAVGGDHENEEEKNARGRAERGVAVQRVGGDG